MNFTIGADPEIFLQNMAGKPISAVGLIGGDKWHPKPLDDKGNAILEDNVAVEFNIAPAHNKDEFLANIRMVMEHIKSVVGDLQFSTDAAISFPVDQLCTPEALLFGCEPDYNAWTGKKNMKPHADDENLRSAGGHVHIGTDLPAKDVIRAADLFLGVPSVAIDNTAASKKRRELYGSAGCYRPKPYGCEYRTLSNFWIFRDDLVHWVYRQVGRALDWVACGNEISAKDGLLIRKAINETDFDAYQKLAKRFVL